jgi:hypothetical protein
LSREPAKLSFAMIPSRPRINPSKFLCEL